MRYTGGYIDFDVMLEADDESASRVSESCHLKTQNTSMYATP